MATLAQMTSFVSRRLQDPNNTAVSSADVVDMINQAQSYWKNERFSFNEVTAEVTLTQGNASVPLPGDFFIPSTDQAFVLEYSGIRYVLKKLSEATYNGNYLSNGIGQPFWYAKLANSGYQVYPIPDQNYTLRLYYLKNYSDLVNPSDSNDFTVNAPNLLNYTALAYGSRDFRQDSDMYTAFMQQAQMEEQNLIDVATSENATGLLTLNSLLA